MLQVMREVLPAAGLSFATGPVVATAISREAVQTQVDVELSFPALASPSLEEAAATGVYSAGKRAARWATLALTALGVDKSAAAKEAARRACAELVHTHTHTGVRLLFQFKSRDSKTQFVPFLEEIRVSFKGSGTTTL